MQWHRSSEKLPDRLGWLDLWESGLRCSRSFCVVLATTNLHCFGLGKKVKLKGEMKVLNVQNKSLHEIGFIYMLSSGLGKCVRSELAVGSFVYIQDRRIIHRFLHFPNGKVRQKTLNLVECFIERVWGKF